jgi:sugar phosphate isomerase/epimerase
LPALPLSRRDLLKFAAAAGVGRAAVPKLPFPTNARDRLSVTSYPFRAYIESPTNNGRKPDLKAMDMTDFPRVVAERFDVRNINPLGDHFRSTDRAYLDRFVKATSDARSHIVDLGLGGRYFYSPDAAARQEAVEFGRKWIDIASVIGSPSVRQHLHGKKGERPNVELAAESLGKMAEYGGKRNVVINLENDSPGSEDPFFLIAIIEKVDNPYLRGLPDFGNSLLGHDAAYNERAVAGMLKHAFNMCHVKDVVETDSGQRSAVDLKRMFELAKNSGYRGYFSMEYETKLGDPFSGTKKLIDETLQYLT